MGAAMNRKLTLTIDNDVIIKAKEYAVRNQTSISRLVENYLSLLTIKGASARFENPPVSDSIRK
jgi:hypothetical protein